MQHPLTRHVPYYAEAFQVVTYFSLDTTVRRVSQPDNIDLHWIEYNRMLVQNVASKKGKDLADSWHWIAYWPRNNPLPTNERLHRHTFELAGGFPDYLRFFTLGGLPQKR